MTPFEYPDKPHVRKHGPGGYVQYEGYRPWLRDEFTFRCVYCLNREQWSVLKGRFHIDHFVSQARRPQAALEYDNLVYACAGCNLAKGNEELPDPCACMLKDGVSLGVDGSISGNTPEARKVISKLGLDSAEYREFRSLFIGVVAMATGKGQNEVLRSLMKYPDSLPDVASLRPAANTRPEGVNESCFARRQRGELPELY